LKGKILLMVGLRESVLGSDFLSSSFCRFFMIGTLTAGQFAIYGDIKRVLGATSEYTYLIRMKSSREETNPHLTVLLPLFLPFLLPDGIDIAK